MYNENDNSITLLINAIETNVQALRTISTEEKAAFDTLYQFFIETSEIIEKAITEGERGYKRAIYRIRELKDAVE